VRDPGAPFLLPDTAEADDDVRALAEQRERAEQGLVVVVRREKQT
jgi:hypothetical protein